MSKTPSLSKLLSQQQDIEILVQRVEVLERAILLLANHVGAVGWNFQLQKTLDEVRDKRYADAH